MILAFSQYFDKKKTKPTYFREKILACAAIPCPIKGGEYPKHDKVGHVMLWPKKLHTIRQGHRWKVGDTIHMAYGVRTKNYQQFNKGIPELAMVKGVQEIVIGWHDPYFVIHIDGRLFSEAKGGDIIDTQTLTLARNDGFDLVWDDEEYTSFYSWFKRGLDGQIIHWTDLKY